MKEKRRVFLKEQIKLFKDKIEKLLAKLQTLNSDPVQFGDKYRIAHPFKWKKIDWHRVYPTAQFTVRVKFTLKENGLFR